ncbi:MAG: cytochrome c, partial [Croceibacterium sp.]
GTAKLPAMPPASRAVPELSPPPAQTGTPATIARGEQLYAAHCALCHGAAARGGIKDLRHMTPETHAAFMDIVLHGARARGGMASFADTLSAADAGAIHDYLISRAAADWGNRP